MFLAALEARNRGDDRIAVELFGSMLGKYPSGKLAEEARIERMRALTRSGDEAKAAAEARRYLARHASGFARDEARSTALGGSQSKP
jgi:outer membrane protein assembly factor BamD (BamD/ComL family)